jgi:hypothetical protein
MGSSDLVVPKADSQVLARQFAAPVVLEHAGGHVLASTAPVRAHVAEFCRELARRKPARPPSAEAGPADLEQQLPRRQAAWTRGAGGAGVNDGAEGAGVSRRR